VDWVKVYLSIWTELQAYIKEFHTTGLNWSKTVSESFFPFFLSFSRTHSLHFLHTKAWYFFWWIAERGKEKKSKESKDQKVEFYSIFKKKKIHRSGRHRGITLSQLSRSLKLQIQTSNTNHQAKYCNKDTV
jgi:hypothetical protein